MVTIADNKINEAPFPTKQLVVLGLCRLAEPIAFISIISYNFALVSDIKGPQNASFWAGCLVSAFAIAEASTAIIWGSLSDKFGRKPIIMMGLLGSVISSLMLGFAKNYWVALAARVAGGLLNGNIGVMQTMVAEIVTNPKHEPRAYSIQPFAWSLGSILGSALGGYAAQPARFYPQYFSEDGLFGRYPYLLPNLIAAFCISLAIVQAGFLLEETNTAVIKQEQTLVEEESTPDERTPLHSHRRSSTFQSWKSNGRRASYMAGSTAGAEEPAFDVRRPSFASIQTSRLHSDSSSESAIEDDDSTVDADSINPTERVFTKKTIMWIVVIAVMCYHQMAFMSVFPIYVLDRPHVGHGLDLHGGLGLTVHDTGRYMAVNSCLSLLIQAFILPLFLGKLGIFRSIAVLSVCVPVIDIAMPLISALPNPGLAVYPAFALMAACNIIIYPAMLIMLKNATPSKQALGKVNGLAVSASSAGRTIAPPLIGMIYTTFGSARSWWSCAAFAILTIGVIYLVPRSKRSDEEIMRRAAKNMEDDDQKV